MATIEVRELDDETIRGLQRRAAACGSTVEEQARFILRTATDDRRDIEEKRAEFDAWYREETRKYAAQGRKYPHPPSEVLIREARDARAGHVWPDEPGR